MKITDPEVIRNGEKDLIDAVKEDLDMEAVRDIIKSRLTPDALTSKGGQIVVHDNQVAFRLDFEINLSGSLLFDRQGNYLTSAEDRNLPLGEPDDDSLDTPDVIADEQALDAFDLDEPEDRDEPEDLDDTPLDLDPPLETVEPEAGEDEPELETLSLEDSNVPDADEDDDDGLHIDLPDYDQDPVEPENEILDIPGDDVPDLKLEDDEPLELDDDDSLELDDDDSLELEDAPPELEIEADVPDMDIDEDAPLDLDLEEVDVDLEEEALADDELLDEGIDNILKESRDFWEQKKDPDT